MQKIQPEREHADYDAWPAIKSLNWHARLEAGLTQAELAERAGTSQPAGDPTALMARPP